MAARKADAGRVSFMATAEVRHPIKAAALLYTAPSFILRGPIYLCFVMVIVAIFYLSWAKKDMIVAAPMLLQRESTTVQAVGGGIVADVLTEPNTPIQAGQPLVVIQEKVRAIASPEQEAIHGEIRELEDKIDQVAKDYDHRISQMRLDLTNAEKGKATEAVGIDSRIAQIRGQMLAAQGERSDIMRKLQLARQRLAQQRDLYQRRDITVTEYQRAEETVNDLESALRNADIAAQQHQLSLQAAEQEKQRMSALTNVDKIRSEINQQTENRERDIQRLQDRISDARKRLNEANTLVQGVSYQDTMANYRASIDGLVTDVHVKKGQLLDAGSPLVTIVKATSALEGRVLVQNKDIGHLKHGQTVQIKYFAYPYQEYGIATGLISEIATKPGGIPGKESLYLVKVALDKETVRSFSGVEKQLEIGLEGFAEIKTGDKRWIEIIFTPLSKFFQAKEEEE